MAHQVCQLAAEPEDASTMSLPAYLRSNPDPLAGLEGHEPAPPPERRDHRPERPVGAPQRPVRPSIVQDRHVRAMSAWTR